MLVLFVDMRAALGCFVEQHFPVWLLQDAFCALSPEQTSSVNRMLFEQTYPAALHIFCPGSGVDVCRHSPGARTRKR
jgi:hypothetical protein